MFQEPYRSPEHGGPYLLLGTPLALKPQELSLFLETLLALEPSGLSCRHL